VLEARPTKRPTRVIRSLARRPAAVIQLLLVAGVGAIALFGTRLAPFDPYALNVRSRLRPPNAEHPFGTDDLGRDILSRVLAGAHTSVPVAVAIPLAAAIVGLLLGSISGYFGGWTDELLMRGADLLLSFPPVILVMAIIAGLGPDLRNAALAMIVVYIPFYARLIRVAVQEEMSREYVQAAMAIGAAPSRIVFRHLWPNVLPVLIVKFSLDIGQTILTFSFLSFIGIGAQPPSPEWGLMVSQGRRFVIDFWWYATFPGLAILLVGTLFTLLGDTLNDLLTPTRGRFTA
jgi:peptide/nickel transport system permease protein